MKLRSGKQYFTSMPPELRAELTNRLNNFNRLFGDDPQHAANLLEDLKHTTGEDIRFTIRDSVTQKYHSPSGALQSEACRAAGKLSSFVLNYPEYQYVIAKELDNFEATSLQGEIKITEEE